LKLKESKKKKKKKKKKKSENKGDQIYNEAWNLLNQLLLLRDWNDSIKMGDGNRLHLLRKILLGYFDIYHRTKYKYFFLKINK